MLCNYLIDQKPPIQYYVIYLKVIGLDLYLEIVPIGYNKINSLTKDEFEKNVNNLFRRNMQEFEIIWNMTINSENLKITKFGFYSKLLKSIFNRSYIHSDINSKL